MLPLESSASTIETGADDLVERLDLLFDSFFHHDQVIDAEIQLTATPSVIVNSSSGRIGGGFGARNRSRVRTLYAGWS